MIDSLVEQFKIIFLKRLWWYATQLNNIVKDKILFSKVFYYQNNTTKCSNRTIHTLVKLARAKLSSIDSNTPIIDQTSAGVLIADLTFGDQYGYCMVEPSLMIIVTVERYLDYLKLYVRHKLAIQHHEPCLYIMIMVARDYSNDCH